MARRVSSVSARCIARPRPRTMQSFLHTPLYLILSIDKNIAFRMWVCQEFTILPHWNMLYCPQKHIPMRLENITMIPEAHQELKRKNYCTCRYVYRANSR